MVAINETKKSKRILRFLGLLIMGLGVYVFIEPYLIDDKIINIVDGDIPKSFTNTKIVFISDIHHGPFFSIARLKNLVRRINNKHPDIVLLGGDYVHRSPKYIESCFNELKLLKAPLGVYGVLGNHDHWEDAALTKKSMENAGVGLLDNKGFWINKRGERLKIGGVGDYLKDTQDINPTISDVKITDFVILVTHNPDYVERLKTDKVDLVLAGHTHGGQVTFLGLWAPLLPSGYGQKYRSGLIEVDRIKVLISNGIGTITPPVRFFARPQIITVILKQPEL